jgi:hypothetical protein
MPEPVNAGDRLPSVPLPWNGNCVPSEKWHLLFLETRWGLVLFFPAPNRGILSAARFSRARIPAPNWRAPSARRKVLALGDDRWDGGKGRSMRIRLIAPRRDEVLKSRTMRSVAPPLALAVLASLTPQNAELSITDENFTPVDFDSPVDLVGITVSTQTAPRAYEVADGFRARGVKVVLGGMHPTAMPQEAALHADSVVVGEAEETWPRLLEDLTNGGLKPAYHPTGHPELASIPVPHTGLPLRVRLLLRHHLLRR